MIKIFAQTEQVPEILKDIKTGAFLKIRGVTTIDRFDGQLSIGSVFGIKKSRISANRGWTPGRRNVWNCTVTQK